METLQITFSGVCTHFRDVAPGVPHRVVLPDATAVHFGYVHLPWQGVGTSVPYYLLPHFPLILGLTSSGPITVPGVIDDGVVYDGATLQIVNAIGDQVEHTSFDETPSITQFVPQYNYAEDVVLGGRAGCYIDVLTGTVSTIPALSDLAPSHIMIEMQTDGPPVLQVTPFRSRATAAKVVTVTLEKKAGASCYQLTVGNMDFDSGDTVQNFDYLLHYLTARGGIPKVITGATPGMTPDPPRQSESDIARALQGLATLIANGGRPTAAMLRLADDLTSACSDSRYP